VIKKDAIRHCCPKRMNEINERFSKKTDTEDSAVRKINTLF